MDSLHDLLIKLGKSGRLIARRGINRSAPIRRVWRLRSGQLRKVRRLPYNGFSYFRAGYCETFIKTVARHAH